ncbi:hypothetical protein CASFOL_037401 [Castilleja foliolosa]|uniref:Replication factor A C-terminal domain-containing protein n=1 Tax=Castilleja foliolosa TaxID=1961234 RepID=A0ABD3BNG1_9LAMI
MACQRIRDIKQRQKAQSIEIRVLRKWTSKGKKEELCYQFVDAYGDSIEATAELKHGKHFEPLVQVQSCYKVSGYICTGPRPYMATVEHPASLVIGQKARFKPITNDNIPTEYFNFATYDTIKRRIKDQRLLTDYIGRLERNSQRSTGTGKRLQKTRLQDEMGREVEITLWPEMQHLYGNEVIPGDIVAIMSAFVTEHNDQIGNEFGRDAYSKTTFSEQSSRNFLCEATIKDIHEDRGWYYVLCSKCSNKLYLEQESEVLNFVCKDDDDIVPNFRYCVNATITDATRNADAVFFNESMLAMLNITCKDMVLKYGETTNPKKVPQLIKSATNTPKLLHLTLKNDGKIVVNNVTEPISATNTQSTGPIQGTSTFTPTTPLSKTGTSKRQLQEYPETGGSRKIRKA